MAAVQDPFESYLRRADALFSAGDIVQAGQIWQAILKKKPEHEIARAGLYKVKLYFDARATQGGLVTAQPDKVADVRATAGSVVKSADPEIAKLLDQGCTLYDAGHVEDALAKWVQVLAKEPDNVLAKGYINGARRTLAQVEPESEISEPALSEPVPAPLAPVPAPVAAAPQEPEVDVERLLRDGCTLFDMGQVEDALKKWEQILAHDPDHVLARAYVQDARKDLGLPPLEEGVRPVIAPVAAGPVMAETTQDEDERIEKLIRDGVQLYDMGMNREAMDKWQQVLVLAPGHRDAEAYIRMAERDQAGQSPTAKPVASAPVSEMSGRDFPGLHASTASRIPASTPSLLLAEPAVEPVLENSPEPVTPPASLTSGAPKARHGFNLPEALQRVSLPPWVASPAFILGTIAGLVILIIGSYYYLQHRKDEALRQAVASFRASATAPVARNAEIPDLQETPEEIRSEIQSALGDDPILAYFRSQELAQLKPGDATVGQLLDRAKADLAKTAGEAVTVADLEKQIQNGQLDAADHSMTVLLSQHPEDPALQARAIRLYGTLAHAYASQEHWPEAEDHLRRARAIMPADKSWSAKLELLKHIQSMAKKERTPWIELLG